MSSREHFKIAGGDIQSFSIGLSGLMCQIMSTQNDQCRTEVTRSSYDSLERVQSHEYDFALVPEYTLNKFFYSDKQNFSDKHVQRVMSLGHVYFYIVVRNDSDIHSIEDLKRKTISLNPTDRPSRSLIEAFLHIHSIHPEKEATIHQKEHLRTSIPKFCKGDYKALAFMDTSPSFYLSLINKACSARILKVSESDINKIGNLSSSFRVAKLKDKKEKHKEYYTLKTPLIFVTNNALSGTFIQQLLAEIKENFFFVTAYHSSLKNLTFEEGFKNPSIPLHTGVDLYLQSINYKGGDYTDVPASELDASTLNVVIKSPGNLKKDDDQSFSSPAFTKEVIQKAKEANI